MIYNTRMVSIKKRPVKKIVKTTNKNIPKKTITKTPATTIQSSKTSATTGQPPINQPPIISQQPITNQPITSQPSKTSVTNKTPKTVKTITEKPKPKPTKKIVRKIVCKSSDGIPVLANPVGGTVSDTSDIAPIIKERYSVVLDEFKERVIKDIIKVPREGKNEVIIGWIIAYLKSLPQFPQKSPGWLAQRKGKLTASVAASPLKITAWYLENMKRCKFQIPYENKNVSTVIGKGCSPYESYSDILLSKCNMGKPFSGNEYTRHGNKYEEIAAKKYARDRGVIVHEYGLVPHPTIDWLGASPDGITDEGIMLEIKCPFGKRDLGEPSLYYWIQIQLQLECCNLELCDFFDCKVREYANEREYLEDLTIPEADKGIILEIHAIEDTEGIAKENIYVEGDTHAARMEWIRNWYMTESQQRPEMWFHAGAYRVRYCYWRILDHKITRIERCREWFALALPQLRAFWDEVDYFKTHKQELQEKCIAQGCNIYDESGRLIHGKQSSWGGGGGGKSTTGRSKSPATPPEYASRNTGKCDFDSDEME